MGGVGEGAGRAGGESSVCSRALHCRYLSLLAGAASSDPNPNPYPNLTPSTAYATLKAPTPYRRAKELLLAPPFYFADAARYCRLAEQQQQQTHAATSNRSKQQHRKKHLPVEAPQASLGGLFGGDGEDEELEQTFATSVVIIGGARLQIRQFAFHCANGNQIWPGAFSLSEFLVAPPQRAKLAGNVVSLP